MNVKGNELSWSTRILRLSAHSGAEDEAMLGYDKDLFNRVRNNTISRTSACKNGQTAPAYLNTKLQRQIKFQRRLAVQVPLSFVNVLTWLAQHTRTNSSAALFYWYRKIPVHRVKADHALTGSSRGTWRTFHNFDAIPASTPNENDFTSKLTEATSVI